MYKPAIGVATEPPIPIDNWTNPNALIIDSSPTKSTKTTVNKVTYPPKDIIVSLFDWSSPCKLTAIQLGTAKIWLKQPESVLG